jgi:hypothetical protein
MKSKKTRDDFLHFDNFDKHFDLELYFGRHRDCLDLPCMSLPCMCLDSRLFASTGSVLIPGCLSTR